MGIVLWAMGGKKMGMDGMPILILLIDVYVVKSGLWQDSLRRCDAMDIARVIVSFDRCVPRTKPT